MEKIYIGTFFLGAGLSIWGYSISGWLGWLAGLFIGIGFVIYFDKLKEELRR
jgi:hypothetical protein